MKKRIATALERAELAFWAQIVKEFPEVRSGDFPPDATFDFLDAQRTALKVWLEWNHPDQALIDQVHGRTPP